MQPTYISVSTLFSAQTRYTVPLFQRPYVWTLEEQWEPLWEDIAGLLERLGARVGDAAVASHFLGTIVLEQVPNQTGSLPRREVIDGQQRLTTLQIMLKAAEHALAESAKNLNEEEVPKATMAKRQLGTLTENLAQGVERYKVWPTNDDRASFQTVLDSEIETGVGSATGSMTQAYRYFRSVFTEYLAGDERAARFQRFTDAVKDHLKVIVLDLDPSDEPQAIFETLNAHGTPLLPADLMKNWLLWEAARQNLDAVPLYEHYWRPFDREHAYWRMRVGTGHAARARVDTFLQNWLTKRTQEAVSAKHIYDRFLRHAAKLRSASPTKDVDVSELLDSIRSDATRYERIDKPTEATRFDVFLQRLKSMDIVVFHPLILTVIERAEHDQDELTKVAEVLESYLVRRMVCALQTRGYGTLALELLRLLDDLSDDQSPAETIRAHLLSETGSNSWPNDELFQTEWTRRRFYGGLRRERVLMILQAIERHYQTQSELLEPLMSFDWSKLQIEHIMPQKWIDRWPMHDGGSAEERDLALHRIGNLTLVSGKLNPVLSNSAWHQEDGQPNKKLALAEHSRLELNRRLLKEYDQWSDDAIKVRGEELFNIARVIWPRTH